MEASDQPDKEEDRKFSLAVVELQVINFATKYRQFPHETQRGIPVYPFLEAVYSELIN